MIVMADSWLVERDVAFIHHFFHKCSTCFHILPKYSYMCLPFFHGSYIVHLFPILVLRNLRDLVTSLIFTLSANQMPPRQGRIAGYRGGYAAVERT